MCNDENWNKQNHCQEKGKPKQQNKRTFSFLSFGHLFLVLCWSWRHLIWNLSRTNSVLSHERFVFSCWHGNNTGHPMRDNNIIVISIIIIVYFYCIFAPLFLFFSFTRLIYNLFCLFLLYFFRSLFFSLIFMLLCFLCNGPWDTSRLEKEKSPTYVKFKNLPQKLWVKLLASWQCYIFENYYDYPFSRYWCSYLKRLGLRPLFNQFSGDWGSISGTSKARAQGFRVNGYVSHPPFLSSEAGNDRNLLLSFFVHIFASFTRFFVGFLRLFLFFTWQQIKRLSRAITEWTSIIKCLHHAHSVTGRSTPWLRKQNFLTLDKLLNISILSLVKILFQ